MTNPVLEYDRTKCPLCGGLWGTIPSYKISAECVNECGITYLPRLDKYIKTVGDYRVYWDITSIVMGVTDEVARVYPKDGSTDIRSRLYIGPTLPYDVSEDLIKIVLVFQ